MHRFTKILLVLTLSFGFATSAQAHPAGELIALFEVHEDYFGARESALSDPSLGEPELVSLAGHPDWRVRTQAAILLGWHRHAELFSEVFAAQSIPGRRDRRHRFLVEVFRDPAAVPAILERIFHGGDRDVVRAGLAHSLVGLHPHWGEDMIGILGATTNTSLAVAAVAALQWSDADVAHAGLRFAFLHSEAEVRALAASVAGWRGDGLALAPELRVALADSAPEARAKAARALGWLADASAADGLEALLDDSSAEVRLHALRSLDRLDSSRAARVSRAVLFAAEQDQRVLRVLKRIRASHD
jgi:HEAT repeat protein